MIASLMMYARPELAGAHARYWALIRAELGKRGIRAPANLSDDVDAFQVWTAPDLVLSQTCGMPYRKWLHDKVDLIGTPDFGLEGCPPGYYRSPIVVRADDPRTQIKAFAPARFAYNETSSQSGYAAIYTLTKPMGFWFSDRRATGGHLASARAVADGRADIAALDAVTWALIQRYEEMANRLRVLVWTDPTPGLPYITAPGGDTTAMFQAVCAAIDGLQAQDRDALGIRGCVTIPKEAYLAVADPSEVDS